MKKLTLVIILILASSSYSLSQTKAQDSLPIWIGISAGYQIGGEQYLDAGIYIKPIRNKDLAIQIAFEDNINSPVYGLKVGLSSWITLSSFRGIPMSVSYINYNNLDVHFNYLRPEFGVPIILFARSRAISLVFSYAYNFALGNSSNSINSHLGRFTINIPFVKLK